MEDKKEKQEMNLLIEDGTMMGGFQIQLAPKKETVDKEKEKK